MYMYVFYIFVLQITEDEDDHTDGDASVANDWEDSSTSSVQSTKRPLKNPVEKTPSSKQQREAKEDMLLEKALSCMQKASSTQKEKDEDDIICPIHSIRVEEN